ncbi:MAG: hypothetical protein RL712_1225 [Bacteroidota bacterium]
MSTRQYIDSFKFVAMQEMRAHGVPASITLGQGVLESASGNSKLAKNCNNHFGIKCRSNWTGKFCLADDDAKDECFRGYETAFDSYRDHSLFLKGGKRYFLLFELSATDYKGWANGLREAGYATNPNYGNILIGVIEKYRLSQYDSMVVFGEDFYSPGVATNTAPVEVNGIQAIMAKPGETPEQVAARYNMSTWQIYKYNDISKGDMLSPGEIIYLKPKRRRSFENNHTVKNGETMREISQKYGVKVKHLYKLNRLEPGLEVRPGEVINLKEKRDVPPAILERNDNPNQVNAVDLILNQRTAPQGGQSKGTVYEVQAGETLQDIAQRMNVSALDLARWNNLDGYSVAAGQILVLRPNVKMSEETQVICTPYAHCHSRRNIVFHCSLVSLVGGFSHCLEPIGGKALDGGSETLFAARRGYLSSEIKQQCGTIRCLSFCTAGRNTLFHIAEICDLGGRN